MTPREVLEKLAALGVKIGPTTLQNYRVWGLMTPPTMKTLGRGKGRSAEYDPVVVGEVYAAVRLMRSDFGFSAGQIRRFRSLWLNLPNPDEPWPPDMIVRAGSLLWVLLRSVSNREIMAMDRLSYSIYAPDEIPTVFKIAHAQRPDLMTQNYPLQSGSSLPGDAVKGLVVIRDDSGWPMVLAVAYHDRFDVISSSKEGAV